MASYNKSFQFSLLLAFMSSICFLISLIEASNKGGITLDLIHRDSPLSPTYDPSKTQFERLKEAIDRSFLRKSNIQSAFLKSSMISSSSNDFGAPVTPGGGEYLMKIQIGTPPVDVMAIADTGSDLTWTQCKPCTSCYTQSNPIFDPSQTSTYQSVTCQSEQCNLAGNSIARCDMMSSNDCNYGVRYADKSSSNGSLAVETLTFGSGSGDSMYFRNVVFGCGHENTGTFSEMASGIVGLGGGSVSIINQLSLSIGGRFSYCLTSSGANVPSKINFGTNAVVTGPNVVSTPITRKEPNTFYFLTLEGISVGNKTISYKSNTNMEAALAGEGNIIIDSGTTLTYLPRDFLNALETELVNVIQATPVKDTSGKYGLCYQSPSSSEFNAPTITAHFSGADVELPRLGIFVGHEVIQVQQGILCLALMPSDGIAIFGNLLQMNYHIGYDLQAQTLSFLLTDCSMSE